MELSCNKQYSRPKIRKEVVALEIHRKLTCGSSFVNFGRCKTQIYFRLQLTKNWHLR